jgi:catechol 2,3-dioxygenase-like lactoylglutathione lyase family enzyme
MAIFDHIRIMVSDARSAAAFYQAALAPLAIEQTFLADREEGVVAGYGRERVQFFIKDAGQERPTPIHLAFAARDRSEVDAFYQAALAAGGRDNGAPGARPQYHDTYYAAFVLDPAGNNVEAVYQG